jgi:hypothetical protein
MCDARISRIKYFQPFENISSIYNMCIKCVLNAWYSCAKNTHLWKNRFCANFKQTNEIGKFAML